MFYRRIAAALAAALTAAALLSAPSFAAPGPVRQTNTGAGNGAAVTVSLKRAPEAGNVIIIAFGLDAASTAGVLVPDDVANVIDMAESWTSFGVAGAPYAMVHGAAARPDVRTWTFRGAAQPVTWLAAELTGVQTFESGVPVWDGGGKGSAHMVGGTETQLNSGHGDETAVAREFLIAAFVARTEEPPTFAALAGPAVPQVTSFANTYEQPGTWTRLGSTTVTDAAPANNRLDVAYKATTVVGSYDCLAVWDGPPSGMAALLVGLYLA